MFLNCDLFLHFLGVLRAPRFSSFTFPWEWAWFSAACSLLSTCPPLPLLTAFPSPQASLLSTFPRPLPSPSSDCVTHRFYSQLQPVIVFISPSCPQVHKPLRSFSRLLLVLLMLPGSRKAFQLRVTCEVSPATLSGCAQRGCTVTSLTASTPTHTVRLFSSRNHAL